MVTSTSIDPIRAAGASRRRWTWLAVVLITVGLAVAPVRAEDEADEFGEMSLQELLQIDVVTPAAKAQRAAESPAVISVLTAEQIRDLGVSTLYEALSYLPGVQVMESYFGYTMVNVRGGLQNHYNNKVLLLINGHPTREVVNGSFHLELIPLNVVDRIELIRGPASVLYGTNAFAGVVNVITRRGGQPDATGVGLGAGSHNTVEVAGSYGTGDEHGSALVAASMRDDSGYPFNVAEDERGASGTLDYENDISNAFVSLEHGELSLFAAYFQQDKQKFGIVPVLEYDGMASYQGLLIDLGWNHELGDDSSLYARLRFDSMDRENDMGHFPADGFQGHEDASTTGRSSGTLFGAEAGVNHTFNEHFAVLGGVVYEAREADPYLFVFDDDGSLHPFAAFVHPASAHSLAGYVQGLVRLSDRADAVVGLRFDEDSDAGSSFVPRLGLVYRIGDDTFVKLLAAEAYRSPDFFEQRVQTYNVLYGDPSLEPERTRNFDIGLDATLGGRFNLQLNAFYLTTEDLIVRIPTTDPDRTGPASAMYANGGGDKIWGLEAAVLGEPMTGLRLFANYSYRQGEQRDTGEDLDYVANHTANLGLVWKPVRRFQVKPNLQMVGSRRGVSSYLLVNLVLTYQLRPELELSLIGRNLTDEEYGYPEYIRGNIDQVPGGPDRSFLARMRWTPNGR